MRVLSAPLIICYLWKRRYTSWIHYYYYYYVINECRLKVKYGPYLNFKCAAAVVLEATYVTVTSNASKMARKVIDGYLVVKRSGVRPTFWFSANQSIQRPNERKSWRREISATRGPVVDMASATKWIIAPCWCRFNTLRQSGLSRESRTI